jgi:hypothetical protein
MADAALDHADPSIASLQFRTRYAEEETPPLVFLHEAWRKIAIAQALGRLNQPPATQPAPDQLVLVSGDRLFLLPTPHKFPEARQMWHDMQDRFAIGWTETFHFIHRLMARSWLNTVYRNWKDGAPLESGIGHAKATIALMTMALGTLFNYSRWRPGQKELNQSWLWTITNGDHLFLIALRLTDSEPGPPTLESVQARLLQCLYLLCTCRLTQALYVFGNVIRMVTELGIHRRRGRNRGLGREILVRPDYARVQCEMRTCWSVYILDKHIAMMTGRSAYLNLDMMDQELPDCVNDEDMGPTGPYRQHKNDCYLEALVEQAKYVTPNERPICAQADIS